MKALLVNGSPHKAGNTATALAEVAKALEGEGVAAETFWIGTKPVRGCAACGACKRDGGGKCIFDDDACNDLIARLRGADAVVVGAPIYYGQPAGQLLALLQRAFFAAPDSVAGKVAASVAVCRRGGSTAAFQCLNMPFQMLNCVIPGSQYWNIAFGRAPGEAAQDAEGMQTMRTLGRNIAWLIKNLRAGGAVPPPAPEPWQPMHFIR
jgi:multimeric flavodoxin WrbA